MKMWGCYCMSWGSGSWSGCIPVHTPFEPFLEKQYTFLLFNPITPDQWFLHVKCYSSRCSIMARYNFFSGTLYTLPYCGIWCCICGLHSPDCTIFTSASVHRGITVNIFYNQKEKKQNCSFMFFFFLQHVFFMWDCWAQALCILKCGEFLVGKCKWFFFSLFTA